MFDLKWEPTPKCPECGEEMDWLDTVLEPLYRLYVCHNDECDGKNLVYNDRKGQEHIEAGDPSGHYQVPRKESNMICPECREELDFLDTIVNKATGRVEAKLYICHSDECAGENLIYNDLCGEENPKGGDPFGFY